MKRVWLVMISFLIIVFVCEISSAQLINYGRRSRYLREDNPDISEDDVPQWAQELVAPQNADERRYDINRDGLLQSAEVKVYLRDIIERVEDREYINVTTDLLREYDKNRDGVINTIEIELMKEHVK